MLQSEIESEQPASLKLRVRTWLLLRSSRWVRKGATRGASRSPGVHLVKLLPPRSPHQGPPPPATGQALRRPAELPAERTVYALRDIGLPAPDPRHARGGGRRVRHRALGLTAPLDPDAPGVPAAVAGQEVRGGSVDEACARALEAEVVGVTMVGRMLERAREREQRMQPPGRRRWTRPWSWKAAATTARSASTSSFGLSSPPCASSTTPSMS
jgi:hypothetical protein